VSELHRYALIDAAARLRDGRVSARDYAQALLARVRDSDASVDAWAHLDDAHALGEAARLDRVARDARGPLHGIPVGLKDIIHTRAMPTRMGSRAFDDFVAPDDAACVRRMIAAGAYAFGKTVTTELAFMHPGKTRNPWHREHTPGGSSQGSPAAVALGHVPGALGTQTNGSVIRPAAYCGVVGFKPTLGAIPFDGVNLFSETLDTLGTFTRSVADAAALASPLADAGRIGPSPEKRARAPRLAYLSDFPWTTLACDADDTLDAAATKLRVAGADIVRVSLPDGLREAAAVHRRIMLHEAARNLGPLQARARPVLSATLDAALDEGRAIDAGEYARALAGRRTMIALAADWLSNYDALIAPPAPAGAPRGLDGTGDPSCCTLASLLGAPAITLPIGLDASGLPLGMQLVANPGSDDGLLAIAAWCEDLLPFGGLV
jgi:Asp-tRNA(Asn)/Glu-tRNA(Gln) amidotransferase A subunit family amidase